MRGASLKLLYRTMLVVILLAMVSCTPTPIPKPSATQNILATNSPAPSDKPTPSILPSSTATTIPTSVPQQPFVKIDKFGFSIDDQPFRFIGANAPNFGFYEQYGLSIDEAIQSARRAGLKVLRIYLAFNNGPWGAKTFEEYDKVMDIATKNGIYIIANLGEGCCYSGNETRDTYLTRLPYANITNETSLKNFEGFIKSILLRENSVNGRLYRDDPTIMAWDIINEPALELFTPAELNTWLSKITAYIKSIDQNHLVTIGLNTSPGIYSTVGDHYSALNVPDLDFFSFHYNTNYSAAAASQLDSIRYRTEMLRSMGKPVVMEEFGLGSQRIFPDNVSEEILVDWVKAYKDQLDAAFTAGTAGALFWGWGVPATKQVLLWWSREDHDTGETQFVQMLQNYQFPPAPTPPPGNRPVATPQPTLTIPADVYVQAVCTLINRPKQTVVSHESPVVILWGWRADSAVNLQDFISNSMTTVTLDGKDIASHAPFWVTNNDPGNFKMYWFAQVGTLSAGTHLIVNDTSFKKMISDGTDTYGPGGTYPTLHDECEILIK